ncbi:MAG: DUF971 domain-containing protein [Candidatus Omnitrophica bacterium]|nr:DUF971 domain-containing protein [Candidatus Omnitrophota bacterium]
MGLIRLQAHEIRPIGEDAVLFLWFDGHRSLYNFRQLRVNCRCARCVDEWTGVRILREEAIPQDLHLRSFETVGRYGVKYRWSDGHDTGIYAFDDLRRSCPCNRCAPSVGADLPSC